MRTFTFPAKAASFGTADDVWGETFSQGHIEELSDGVD